MRKECHYCENYGEFPMNNGCGECDALGEEDREQYGIASTVYVLGKQNAEHCPFFEETDEYRAMVEDEYEEQLREQYRQRPTQRVYKQHEL